MSASAAKAHLKSQALKVEKQSAQGRDCDPTCPCHEPDWINPGPDGALVCEACQPGLIESLRRSKGEDVRLLRDLERYAIRRELGVYYVLGLLKPAQLPGEEKRSGKKVASRPARPVYKDASQLLKSIAPRGRRKQLAHLNEYQRGWLDGRVSALRRALNLHAELMGREAAS